MPRTRRNINAPEVDALPLPPRRSRSVTEILVPTEDRRHMSHIREGRISFEVFSKKRLKEVGVDIEVQLEREAEDRVLKAGLASKKPTRKPRGKSKSSKVVVVQDKDGLRPKGKRNAK